MKKEFISILLILSVLFLVGCGHNVATIVVGKGLLLNASGFNYFSGVAVIDTSRENAYTGVELADAASFSVTPSNGTVKGVRKIERRIGKIASGYTADLANADKDVAKAHMENDPIWNFNNMSSMKVNELEVSKAVVSQPTSKEEEKNADLTMDEFKTIIENNGWETKTMHDDELGDYTRVCTEHGCYDYFKKDDGWYSEFNNKLGTLMNVVDSITKREKQFSE